MICFELLAKPLTKKSVLIPQIRKFSHHNEGPSFIIKQRITEGQIKADPRQTAVISSLQELYENIKNYSPGKFLATRAPKGLYIFGSVGTGKTMLMDIFYHSVKVAAKRRVHFNNFMADIHSRIHKLKTEHKSSSKLLDPIKPTAKQLVKESWLLCFDEFQVTDIADAMILKSIFTEMFSSGMVMVATSNRPPDDLYKNGLQRSNFLPFIPVLKNHCKIVSISGKDYRLSFSEENQKRYLISGKQGTTIAMEIAFKKLCLAENKNPVPKTLKILGHRITFPNTCGRVLYASFSDLCDKPLGSVDYIEIAKNFNTILIKDVPKMSLNTRNQVRRFILLIDTLYDNKVKIMLTAADEPHNLFSVSAGKPVREDYHRTMMDDLEIEKGSENSKASLFSGSEEVFAFDRTVSRIREMCSNAYWERKKK